MTIKDTCCCGAAFEVSGNGSASPQIAHRDWLAVHAPCREANIAKITVELGKTIAGAS